MIIGMGIDLVEVVRVRHLLDDPKIGLRFRDRVYTKGEIDYCEGRGRGKYESYAGRFAAKEAVMKAMGTGWGPRVGWLDIEVLPIPGGKPEVTLCNGASELARELRIRRLSVSISHTKSHAIAYVIAEGE
jgi:holo-[acyl-carrier protein] synthase